MDFRTETIDAIDRRLLALLQANARLSFTELGKAVHLSSSAAADRVRGLEERGVIRAYQTQVSPEKLDRPMQALIRLRTSAEYYGRITADLEKRTGVVECLHVTGEDSLAIRAWVKSMDELEELVGQLGKYGETSTSLVLATLLDRPLTG